MRLGFHGLSVSSCWDTPWDRRRGHTPPAPARRGGVMAVVVPGLSKSGDDYVRSKLADDGARCRRRPAGDPDLQCLVNLFGESKVDSAAKKLRPPSSRRQPEAPAWRMSLVAPRTRAQKILPASPRVTTCRRSDIAAQGKIRMSCVFSSSGMRGDVQHAAQLLNAFNCSRIAVPGAGAPALASYTGLNKCTCR